MRLYRIILPVSMVAVLTVLPDKNANAQFIISAVLNETVGKVIRAIDLAVQRAQNQTIWLQNAQKVVETQLNQLRLSEIAGISQQQTDLFTKYYNELSEVKSSINDYEQVRNITLRQEQLVKAYQNAWSEIQMDGHFSASELKYIESVYTGILNQSVANLDQLMNLVTSLKTQMTDEKRVDLIGRVGKKIDENYNDLKRFNNQNILLSLSRAHSQQDAQTVKNLYGIQ